MPSLLSTMMGHCPFPCRTLLGRRTEERVHSFEQLLNPCPGGFIECLQWVRREVVCHRVVVETARVADGNFVRREITGYPLRYAVAGWSVGLGDLLDRATGHLDRHRREAAEPYRRIPCCDSSLSPVSSGSFFQQQNPDIRPLIPGRSACRGPSCWPSG